MAVLDGDRIVNIVESIGPAEITLRTWVGQSCPAYATSSGKVLLAGLEPADVRARLRPPWVPFTDATVTTVAELAEQLATVRERGWASVTEELEVGLNAVAAPIFDVHSQVVAALSVSGPAYRLSVERFDEVAKRTVNAADAVSRRLGWSPGPVRTSRGPARRQRRGEFGVEPRPQFGHRVFRINVFRRAVLPVLACPGCLVHPELRPRVPRRQHVPARRGEAVGDALDGQIEVRDVRGGVGHGAQQIAISVAPLRDRHGTRRGAIARVCRGCRHRLGSNGIDLVVIPVDVCGRAADGRTRPGTPAG